MMEEVFYSSTNAGKKFRQLFLNLSVIISTNTDVVTKWCQKQTFCNI